MLDNEQQQKIYVPFETAIERCGKIKFDQNSSNGNLDGEQPEQVKKGGRKVSGEMRKSN